MQPSDCFYLGCQLCRATLPTSWLLCLFGGGNLRGFLLFAFAFVFNMTYVDTLGMELCYL